jgi:hypothetical protein
MAVLREHVKLSNNNKSVMNFLCLSLMDIPVWLLLFSQIEGIGL